MGIAFGTAEMTHALRNGLSADARRRARRLADRLFKPVTSINGAGRASRSIGLTFDDGPDSIVTPRVLDLLAARQARATFFVLTERAERQPTLIRRMADEGHEIALHADRHDRLTRVPVVEVRRRLRRARRSLEALAGQRVRFFRPPFGAQSLATYLAARSCGLEVVVWGPYAEDWVENRPDVVAAKALTNLRGGDVLLLHDGLEKPDGEPLPTFDRVRAFELILDGLAMRGLRADTVGALTTAGARGTAWFRP